MIQNLKPRFSIISISKHGDSYNILYRSNQEVIMVLIHCHDGISFKHCVSYIQ